MRGTARQRDAVLAALLASYGLFEVLSGVAPGVGAVPGDPAVSASAAAVAGLAVALRTRAPLVGLALSVAPLVLEALLTQSAEGLGPLVAQMVLVHAVASRAERWVALAALVLAVGLLGATVGDPVFLGVLYAVPWLAGRVLGERQRQLAALHVASAEEARGAVAEERRRIARELHDVVSHALSLVVVQSQVAHATVRTDPSAAEASLLAVKGAAQQALADMRRMLGVLSDEAEPLAPQPGLDELPALVERVRATGLQVVLREEGEARQLPPGASLTAYRVLQEALTNVLRHASAARAEVVLGWTPSELRLQVVDDGTASGSSEEGRGLVGLRERVGLYGGSLEAGPGQAGGFEVTAVLPA